MNIFGQIIDEVEDFLDDVGQDVLRDVENRFQEKLQSGTRAVVTEAAKQPSVQKGIAGFAFDELIIPLILIAALFVFFK